MSLNEAIEAIPRKTMVLFFIVDTSGSMGGSKIGALNAAIEEALPELRDLSAANADAQIKIAVLEFSTGAQWITAMPMEVETFVWNHLDAGGGTDLAAAFDQLNEKLSVKAFMREAAGSFAPALFLMSDGEASDSYQSALANLKNNNWFKQAVKVAIAIGNDANKQCLAEFTGYMESVLEVHNVKMLKKMIKFVSVRASQVASQSSMIKRQNGGSLPQAPAAPVPAASSTTSSTTLPTSLSSALPQTQTPAAVPPPPPPSLKQQQINQALSALAADDDDEEW
jgi:uncharacterized protein YegL